MEALFTKMKEYLQMDHEIPFAEFTDYHNQVIALLNADFGEMDKDTLVQVAGICQIVSINATARGSRKDANAKRFKKIAEKAEFWYKAICYKLTKTMGMTQSEIDEATEALWA